MAQEGYYDYSKKAYISPEGREYPTSNPNWRPGGNSQASSGIEAPTEKVDYSDNVIIQTESGSLLNSAETSPRIKEWAKSTGAKPGEIVVIPDEVLFQNKPYTPAKEQIQTIAPTTGSVWQSAEQLTTQTAGTPTTGETLVPSNTPLDVKTGMSVGVAPAFDARTSPFTKSSPQVWGTSSPYYGEVNLEGVQTMTKEGKPTYGYVEILHEKQPRRILRSPEEEKKAWAEYQRKSFVEETGAAAPVSGVIEGAILNKNSVDFSVGSENLFGFNTYVGEIEIPNPIPTKSREQLRGVYYDTALYLQRKLRQDFDKEQQARDKALWQDQDNGNLLDTVKYFRSETRLARTAVGQGLSNVVLEQPLTTTGTLLLFRAGGQVAPTFMGNLGKPLLAGMTVSGLGKQEYGQREPLAGLAQSGGTLIAYYGAEKAMDVGVGYIRTAGKTNIPVERIVKAEVIEGREQFPLIDARGQLGSLRAYEYQLPVGEKRIPGTTRFELLYPKDIEALPFKQPAKVGGWHTTKGELAKPGTVFVVDTGSSEIGSLYLGTYGLSPAFLRIKGGVTDFFKSIVDTMVSQDTPYYGGDPNAYFITPKRFEKMSPKKLVKGVETKYDLPPSAEEGVAYATNIKAEAEASIKPGSEIKITTPNEYYFNWKGERVPIIKGEAVGAGQGDLIVSQTGRLISKKTGRMVDTTPAEAAQSRVTKVFSATGTRSFDTGFGKTTWTASEAISKFGARPTAATSEVSPSSISHNMMSSVKSSYPYGRSFTSSAPSSSSAASSYVLPSSSSSRSSGSSSSNIYSDASSTSSSGVSSSSYSYSYNYSNPYPSSTARGSSIPPIPPFFALPPFREERKRERLSPTPKRKYAYTPDLIALVLNQRTTKMPASKLYGGEERRLIYVSERKTKKKVKGKRTISKKKLWWQSKLPL